MDYLSFEELKRSMEAGERTLDFDKIKEAYDLAVRAHEGQTPGLLRRDRNRLV